MRAVLGVLRLSTRGHRSLDSLLSDHWRQLLVLQSTEERVRGKKKKEIPRNHKLPRLTPV